MDRREFVKAGVAASLAAGVPAMAEAPKKSRPNVLYVFSDQHRAASLPGEPFSEVIAPNIDAFRRANFSMDTCISNYPLCTPYRGILMTGKYPCQSGLVINGLSMKTTEHTLTKTFKDAGYRTGYVGKWHLGEDGEGDESEAAPEKSTNKHDGGFVPKGPGRFSIDDWHIWASTNKHYSAWTYDPETGEKIVPQGWGATAMTDQAIKLLKSQSADKPWFMVLSWNPPHPPFDPPAADQAPYASKTKKRPNVKVATGETGKGAKFLRSDDVLHKAMEGYFGAITGVDAEFGRILKVLEETGEADNTIVIYTSDHGEMMGSQGRMAKQVPYEESCHVPFAVRYPGVTPKGGSSKVLFAAVDIYPTVCGLAGVAVPSHCAGKDLSGIMKGKNVAASEEVFLMCGSGDLAHARHNKNADSSFQPGLAPTYRGIRTATHMYAVTAGGRWLLFDIANDPYQMKNLAHEAEQKPLMDAFDAKIKAWMKTTGDQFQYPVSA